jgi:hypothetical protein
MKILLENYTFNAAAKQITFATSVTVSLENILLITNVSTNTIIYNFANPAQGGTIANNVLTLTYDTAAMTNDDRLQIFLDMGETEALDSTVQSTNDLLTQVVEQTMILKRLTRIMESNSVVDTSQRQRVAVESIPSVTIGSGTVTTVSTVSTVSALTNLQQINAMSPFEYNVVMSRNAYANSIRSQLTFS